MTDEDWNTKEPYMRHRVIVVTGSLIVLAVVSAQTNAQTLTTLFSFDGTHGANPRRQFVPQRLNPVWDDL